MKTRLTFAVFTIDPTIEPNLLFTLNDSTIEMYFTVRDHWNLWHLFMSQN